MGAYGGPSLLPPFLLLPSLLLPSLPRSWAASGYQRTSCRGSSLDEAGLDRPSPSSDEGDGVHPYQASSGPRVVRASYSYECNQVALVHSSYCGDVRPFPDSFPCSGEVLSSAFRCEGGNWDHGEPPADTPSSLLLLLPLPCDWIPSYPLQHLENIILTNPAVNYTFAG